MDQPLRAVLDGMQRIQAAVAQTTAAATGAAAQHEKTRYTAIEWDAAATEQLLLPPVPRQRFIGPAERPYAMPPAHYAPQAAPALKHIPNMEWNAEGTEWLMGHRPPSQQPQRPPAWDAEASDKRWWPSMRRSKEAIELPDNMAGDELPEGGRVKRKRPIAQEPVLEGELPYASFDYEKILGKKWGGMAEKVMGGRMGQWATKAAESPWGKALGIPMQAAMGAMDIGRAGLHAISDPTRPFTGMGEVMGAGATATGGVVGAVVGSMLLPGVGTIIGGIIGREAGKVVGGVISSTIGLPDKIREWGEAAMAQTRPLSRYDARIANTEAMLDYQQRHLNIRTAHETGASTERMGRGLMELREATQPLGAELTNLRNELTTVAENAATAVIKVATSGSGSGSMLGNIARNADVVADGVLESFGLSGLGLGHLVGAGFDRAVGDGKKDAPVSSAFIDDMQQMILGSNLQAPHVLRPGEVRVFRGGGRWHR